ncbi:MAG: iron-containing alcohol dehydrogenase [Candidatus Methanospirare jalkutatii]|nr:iron-containing alcohol dehydrogenase [Candidatus Methanospirare jalkutatii]
MADRETGQREKKTESMQGLIDSVSILSEMPAVQMPRVVFGKGILESLGVEASSLLASAGKKAEGSKALLVTDEEVAARFSGRVEEALKSAGLETEVFRGVKPEPSLEVAESVAEFARRTSPDIVVGLGGGSVLDMAKVASAAVTNEKPAREFLGANKIERRPVPKILMPTTAGTGAEATPYALVVVEGKKKAIASPYNLADVAFLDAELTATMPPRVTASTGMDALSHALEALMSKGANPLTDAFAYAAIWKVAANLERAFSSPQDLDARLEMALAAFLAGVAFGNAGVVLGHAIAHNIGTRYAQPHGVATALTIPYVMEFNASVPEVAAKLKCVASAFGEDVSSLSDADAAAKAVAHAQRMLERLELPKCLADLNVSREDLPAIADAVLAEKGYLARNPREVNRENLLALLERMHAGF